MRFDHSTFGYTISANVCSLEVGGTASNRNALGDICWKHRESKPLYLPPILPFVEPDAKSTDLVRLDELTPVPINMLPLPKDDRYHDDQTVQELLMRMSTSTAPLSSRSSSASSSQFSLSQNCTPDHKSSLKSYQTAVAFTRTDVNKKKKTRQTTVSGVQLSKSDRKDTTKRANGLSFISPVSLKSQSGLPEARASPGLPILFDTLTPSLAPALFPDDDGRIEKTGEGPLTAD